MLIFLVHLCCTIMCLTFCIPCYDICYGFHMDTMFGSSLPSVVCRRDHVLFTLFVLACMWWCPACVMLCICFVFLCLVYPVLPVYLDCPFVISLRCSLTFIFFILVTYTVNQVHHGNIVCLWIEINNICPSYIEKALLHLNAQMT